jgi:hypothetical protein
MRRMRALGLFTLGYAVMALFSPSLAAAPALVAFALASLVLVREEQPERARARVRYRPLARDRR